MIFLRSLLFGIGMYGVTVALLVPLVPMLLLPRRLFGHLVRLWARTVLWLARTVAGIDFQVRGEIPPAPAILAVKHQSAWETIALNLILPDAAFVLKRELMHIPLFGWGLAKMRNVATDRGGGAAALRRMTAAARQALQDKRYLVVFPEGTRTAAGTRNNRYHPGIAALYAGTGRAITPVALNSGCFWPRRGFIKRPGRILVEFLPPVEPGLPPRQLVRELAARIETATARLESESGQPLVTLPPPQVSEKPVTGTEKKEQKQ